MGNTIAILQWKKDQYIKIDYYSKLNQLATKYNLYILKENILNDDIINNNNPQNNIDYYYGVKSYYLYDKDTKIQSFLFEAEQLFEPWSDLKITVK